MFCSKCGAKLIEGSGFCSSCGEPTGTLQQSRPTSFERASSVPGSYAPPPLVHSEVYRPPAYPPSEPMIATPAPYAGFWLRFVAYLIDHLILGFVFGIGILICVGIVGVGYVEHQFAGMNADDPAFAGFIVSAAICLMAMTSIVSWIYFAGMESSTRQGTLGKMAMGLIVTDLADQRISFGRATGRFFSKFITALIPFAIGYIMAGFTEKKQALHDMIASTLVLRRN